MLFFNKKNALNISIISIFLSIFIYIFIQIQSNNIHKNILRNTSQYAIAGVLLFLIILNIAIYHLTRHYTVFLATIILEFLLLYTLCLFTITHIGILYFPVVMLILVSIYRSNMLFNAYLTGYLFCTSTFIVSIILNATHHLALLNFIQHSFLNHMLLSLILIMIISILYYSKKIIIPSEQPLNLIPTQVAYALNKITYKIPTPYTSINIETPINILEEIDTNIINDSYDNSTTDNNDSSYISIVKTNVKSAYTLSSDIKKALFNIDTLNDDIISYTSHIKDQLFNTTDCINELHRNTFNLTSSHKNIQSDLEDTYENAQTLKNILIELENLSVMTTHLANKATLEKTYTPPSPEVMNFIIKEFHSYSDEIRNAVRKMSTIFSTLDKKYYSCNKEFKHSADLIGSCSLTLNKITNSLDTINSDFNNILRTDADLKTSLKHSQLNAKRLVADTSELRANISYIVGNTYSTKISKLSQK